MDPSIIASSMTVVGQIDVSTTTHILTAMDIFKEVSLFYESAWSKLIWTFGTIIAITGLIIPLISNKIQKSKTKKIIKDIDDKIKMQKEEFEKIISVQKNEYELKIESQKLMFEEQINQQKLEFIEQQQHHQQQFEKQKQIMQAFYDKTKYDVNSLSARFWHAQATNSNNSIAYSMECVSYAMFFYNENKEIDGISRVVSLLIPHLITQNQNIINKNTLKQIVNILNKLKEDKSIILDANLEANINAITKFYTHLLNI